MPSSERVLITGASAFIGLWVCKKALSRGYTVVGTVRSKEKGEYVQRVLKKYGDRFSFAIVEDVEKEQGFDELVKDVSYVCHLASPFHYTFKDPQKELIDPALSASIILIQCHTSLLPKWSVDEFKAGRANPQDCYRTSKVLAERAAYDFVKKNKTTFDIATINPPFVYGPVYQQVDKPESLNTSVAAIYKMLKDHKPDPDPEKGYSAPAGLMADVRDVAFAHVEALTAPEASNHRFPLSTQGFSWQDCLDAFAEPAFLDKIKDVFQQLPRGEPGATKGKQKNWYSLDQTDCKKILGLQFTPFAKTMQDTALMLAERERSGWKLEPAF